MVIENGISDGIDFFHMDALSSAVALKVDCDLQLTLMASSLYRLFASEIANGYHTADSSHIFRDLIKGGPSRPRGPFEGLGHASANITIGAEDILVKFQKRAHNPFLLKAKFDDLSVPIPWWGNKRLRFQFG